MNIGSYQYIAHKIIPRPWGVECRFTVARLDGSHINDIAMVSSTEITEGEIEIAIAARLAIVDTPREPEPSPREESITLSEIDQSLIESKNVMKLAAIGFIKANPECAAESMNEYLASTYGETALIVPILIHIYKNGAMDRGFIPDDSFESFRDWVVMTPESVLLEI